jgi:Domain of unknown function (DUF4278)
MKLTYRGVDYDANLPTLEVTDSEILCKYRGRPYQYNYVRHVPFPQTAAALTYRGVAYATNRFGQIESVSQPERTSVFAKVQTKMNKLNPMNEKRRRLLQEAARVHQENVRRSLEHRIEVAKNQGNMLLLNQLEDEMRHLV